ncbi:MAG: RluA family pseudouridine synthase [Nitrospirae bacterium]|nr:RluA family pseudouridine synthase [Nitrospirota bacterium]
MSPIEICNRDKEEMLIRVSEEDSGKRIDKLVSEKTGISRSQVHLLIDKGMVTLDGKTLKPDYRAKANAILQITIPEKPPPTLIPENIPVNIFYRDEFLAVVDKPQGMVVYPAVGHEKGTLMNALAFHIGSLEAVGGPLRPGVVHRLDKDTSGVMVVALRDDAYYGLIEQFKNKTINKQYIALVYGKLKEPRGRISSGIGRSPSDRKKMSTKAKSLKKAQTEWAVIERFRSATLLNIKLLTGRTHQIRVHFASIGNPVLGDKTYGKKTVLNGVRFSRQMLHSGLLGFVHPIIGQYMEFKSPLPEDMKKAIEDLI